MYCQKHSKMIRCNSLQESECKECGEKFITFNAPPLNMICKNCSEKLSKCEYCGDNIRLKS